MTTEPVIRRSGTRRNGGRPQERLSLDAVEEGIAYRVHDRPRRRKKRPASFSILLRRWLLWLHSNPENIFKCAAGTIATALIVPYMVRLFRRHSTESALASPTPVPLSRTIPKQKSHAAPKPHIEPHPFASTFQLLFEHPTLGQPMHFPEALDMGSDVDYDFGGLEFRLLVEDTSGRVMMWDWEEMETDFRLPDAPNDDDLILYYAFDDDVLRSVGSRGESVHDGEDDFHCRRVAEHRLSFPNCNSFHESPLIDLNAKYLSAGTYRQVLVMDNPVLDRTEKIIVKDITYDYDATHEHYEYVRMDVMVAERLTASPRIYDVYGLCGLGVLSEFFPHGDIEDEIFATGGYSSQEDLLKPQNNFTGLEKLEISLGMAEALADLHGNLGGVMVHQDVQPSQFLWSADKSILKLNDFNRAEFMLFDEQSQEYCPYREGHGHGNWRSPEEYFDGLLTEQVDVWSLGNNMYGLLTGLYVFYDEEHVSVVQRRIMDGETAYIDPRYKSRSPSEGKLVDIIEKCFTYDPADRPSIFEIIEMLRAAILEVKKAVPTPMPSTGT